MLFERRGPGGTRLGAFLGRGIVFCDGRLSAMLSGRADEWALAAKIDLAEGDAIAAAALRDLAGGERMFHRGECDESELRRYDLAFEHEFTEPADGLAFLRACGSLLVSQRKTNVWRGVDGHVQTVYWRTAKRGVVTERIYDKGLESGSHRAGERIRIEVQVRPAKRDRRQPAVVARMDLTPEFGRRMRPFVANETVVVGGVNAAAHHLAGRAARGELSMAKAERLAGSFLFFREFGRALYPDERQQRRRIADLRSSGVAINETLPPSATVPVGRLLANAIEGFTA